MPGADTDCRTNNHCPVIGYGERMDAHVDNSITKSIHVLGALRTLASGASARELALLADLPRSTVQRILSTLNATGMVTQDLSTQKYKIGPRALLIGLGYNNGLTLVAEARPQMIALRDLTQETVGLSVAIDDTRVFLEEVQSTQELRFASELGKMYPLWSGANGRVLMSSLTPERIRELLTNHRFDEAVDRVLGADEVLEQLAEFERTGYAMAFSEAIANVHSIAVPIRDASGAVSAALSVSGPAQRFEKDKMLESLEPLRAAADAITTRIGGRRSMIF